MHPFRQVDVFPGSPLGGNPVAVVLDADDVDAATMQAFARWTNLSETVFVLRPSSTAADYRLRIFTPSTELPFAGHPTLGAAHAWSEHTGGTAETLVQQCAAGSIELRRTEGGWAFAAPPPVRSGPASPEEVAAIAVALRIPAEDVLEAEWVDNGPGWVAARLETARQVLELRPDFVAMPFPIGVVGAWGASGPADHEVRAFIPGAGVAEDPVTGSLNAGIAQWFFRSGLEVESYTVRQGTVLGADGLVVAARQGDVVWIAGGTRTVVSGSVDLGVVDAPAAGSP